MNDEIDLPPGEGGDAPPPGNGLIRYADTFFAGVAGLTLFAMMLMTTVDVIGRYFLAAPLGFAFELTQMGMAVIVFAAFPSVTLRGMHVTVGLFENAVKGRARGVRDALIALTIGACSLHLAWTLSTLAARFISYGDETSMLGLPIGIIAWIGVGGLVMAGIAAAVHLALALRLAAQGDAR